MKRVVPPTLPKRVVLSALLSFTFARVSQAQGERGFGIGRASGRDDGRVDVMATARRVRRKVDEGH